MNKIKNYLRNIFYIPHDWYLLWIPKEYFTIRRLINLYKKLISYFLSLVFKHPFMWGYPMHISMSATTHCNLKCPQCPAHNDSTTNKGFMSFELFKKIIDEVHEYSYLAQLFSGGESFLHKDICKMIEYAHSKKMKTLISSNLNIMPPAEDLVNSGLSELIIDVDGVTQETYEKYRVNGSLEKVLENTKALVKAKKQLKKSTPTLIAQFIIMKHNEHEVEAFKKLAKELGVNKYEIRYMVESTKSTADTYSPDNKRFSLANNIETKGFNRCLMLFTKAIVLWDGTGKACCSDHSIMKLGNVSELGVLGMYESKAFMQLREAVLTDRNKIEMCATCQLERGQHLQMECKSI
jgi:MoaA/NifB/PqqE/SkfB family radical SAM enzyme